MAKLIDYAVSQEQLQASPNPFALVTAAHLYTQKTKHDYAARYDAKIALIRLLYRQGWGRQRILEMFAVLDWMMRLPKVLEQKLWQDIDQIEGETKMRYVTSIERLAIERGVQQGIEKGIEKGEAKVLGRQLTKRFGALSAETTQRLQNATSEQLEMWAERILDASTLAGVFGDH